MEIIDEIRKVGEPRRMLKHVRDGDHGRDRVVREWWWTLKHVRDGVCELVTS